MRKPKTLQFRLSLASKSDIVKEVIANYVLIKRLVGAVIFRGFYNHKRHKRRRTEDGENEPGSFAFFSPPNIRLYTYVTNIFRNEGTPVPTYLPFIYYLSYVCKLIHVVNVCLFKTTYKVFSSRIILALFFPCWSFLVTRAMLKKYPIFFCLT